MLRSVPLTAKIGGTGPYSITAAADPKADIGATPLMHLSKKETVLMALELRAIPAMALTHTCYLGERPPCGQCAACMLRAKGFAEAGIADPLLER